MQKRNWVSGWSVGALVCVIAAVMFVGAAIAALLMTLALLIRALARHVRRTALGQPAIQKKPALLVARTRHEADFGAVAPQRAK